MADKIYLYPLWLRIWHIFNALLYLLLILSGISLHFSDPEYPLIDFKTAVTMHDVSGILLALNYAIFVVLNVNLGNTRYYTFSWKGWPKRLLAQAKYYTVGVFKGEEPPFPISEKRKFNPLQKFSYIMVMYFFTPMVIITGIGLLFPGIVVNQIFETNGLYLTNIFHLITAYVVTMFLIIHVYFSTMGPKPTSYFKSMINGWHES